MDTIFAEPKTGEIARNVVESQRLSTLIDYATSAPFAIGFLETALAIGVKTAGAGWNWAEAWEPALIEVGGGSKVSCLRCWHD